MNTTSKHCTKCSTTKTTADFHKHKATTDGLVYICKACTKAKTKAWKMSNAESCAAKSKAWQLANPAKRAASDGKANAVSRNPQCIPEDYDINTCIPFYKEARRLSTETGVPHEVDHITPVSKGGLHHFQNLQVLTKAANQAKSDSLAA